MSFGSFKPFPLISCTEALFVTSNDGVVVIVDAVQSLVVFPSVSIPLSAVSVNCLPEWTPFTWMSKQFLSPPESTAPCWTLYTAL